MGLPTKVWRGGSGGLSGGGGSSGEWRFQDYEPSEFDYFYDCGAPRAYLGMVYDVIDLAPESFQYKVMMQRETTPEDMGFYSFGSPPKHFTDYKYGDLPAEVEDSEYLPIPEICFSPGWLVYISALAPASTSYRQHEWFTDGATYHSPFQCGVSFHNQVLSARGQAYIDAFPITFVPGESRVWQWKYEAVTIERYVEGAALVQPVISGLVRPVGSSFWKGISRRIFRTGADSVSLGVRLKKGGG